MTAPATISLAGGTTIPQLGFGVFKVPPEDTESVVGEAIAAGYRCIDTAAAYGNEAEVGRAVAASGLDRSEFHITTKLWNSEHGRSQALAAFEAALDRLGMDHVDLYLVHWPMPSKGLHVETWLALEEILDSGRTRAIGVSNFQIQHLRDVLEAGSVVPAVNQVELHPGFSQGELRAFHAEHGIATEAWSPLARAALFDHPVIAGIATRLDATPAQVVLAWHLALGNIVIPKSVSPQRIRENFAATGVRLEPADIDAINGLHDDDGRIGPNPDEFNMVPD